MKNFKFVSLFYCVLLFTDVKAGVTDTASREVIKFYNQLNKERLLIDNRFGSVTIQTWKESVIRITVRITGKGLHKPAAITAMGKPGIKESRDEYLISCSTFFSGLKQKDNNGDVDCSIDYLVQMPQGLALDIHNEFGDIIIGDYEGPIDITQQYGNLFAGRLKQAGKIKLSQGNAKISGILNGDLSSRGFDSILVEQVSGIVKVNAKAGDKLELGLVKGLVSFSVNAAHVGDLTIKTGKEISANLGLQTVLSLMHNNSDIVLEEKFSGQADTTPVDQNAIHKKKRVPATAPRVPATPKKKRMPSQPQDPGEPQHPAVEPKKTPAPRVKPDSPRTKKSEKPAKDKSEKPAKGKPEKAAKDKSEKAAKDKSEKSVKGKPEKPAKDKSEKSVPVKPENPVPSVPDKSESREPQNSESSRLKKTDKLSPKHFEGSRGKANVPIDVQVAYSTLNLF
ncbi:hypothetical protein [Flavitalea sp.]|nr:hypothetical protein [Flavitalea sp.]